MFKISPTGQETVLYSFGSQAGDGAWPSAGVIMDESGNLYGVTDAFQSENGNIFVGTVFKLTPEGQETVLHTFTGYPNDGGVPSTLIMDAEGNLYGTTLQGGKYGTFCGTVFRISSTGQETILYSFGSYAGDGYQPYAGVIMDKNGNLYGTTLQGGAYQNGTVFELTPAGVETVLYSFTGGTKDGGNPYPGLVMDEKGNLYGATSFGPGANSGTAFELSPATHGRGWAFHALHHFNLNLANTGEAIVGNQDGWEPGGNLALDEQGNLYGTTLEGGLINPDECYSLGCGAVFKLTP